MKLSGSGLTERTNLDSGLDLHNIIDQHLDGLWTMLKNMPTIPCVDYLI